MLDNIPHIKAYWIMMTPGVAQIAQRFGADDIDGRLWKRRFITTPAHHGQHLRRQDLLRLIREAGRDPVSAIPPIGRWSVPNRLSRFWFELFRRLDADASQQPQNTTKEPRSSGSNGLFHSWGVFTGHKVPEIALGRADCSLLCHTGQPLFARLINAL